MNRTISLFSASVATSTLLAAAISTPVQGQSLAPMAPVVQRISATTSPVQGGFEAALSALRRNQWAEAIRYFTPLVNLDGNEQRGQARYGLAIAFSQLGEDAKALQSLEGTLQDTTPLGRAIGELRGNLMLQLADKHLAEKGFATPNPWLAQYERLLDQPNRARYERLRAATDTYTADSSSPSMVLRVGVILPLSGQLADVGTSILHGLQLGLQEFDGRRGTRLELLVTDASDAKQAEAAATRLSEQNIDVVVGPLLAAAVSEAGAILNARNIPVMALSNDKSVLGRGVYAVNYLPSEQARLIARHAISNGKQRLAVLAPSTPYGTEATEAFRDEVRRLGGQVTGSAFYDPKATDIGASIREIAGTSKDSLPFDALFVPAPALGMPLIKAQLSYYNINNNTVMLLGTGLWQNNDLLKSGSGMMGSVFAAPPKAFGFEQTYTAAFGSPGNALALVGYDTARILTDVAAEKQRTGGHVVTLLQRPEGFYGNGGYFRFASNGLSQRGLDVVGIGRQFEVKAPALVLPPLPLPNDLQPKGATGPFNWR